MPYVTSLERYAREKGQDEGRDEGLVKGRHEAIESVLEIRFSESVPALMTQVKQLEDLTKLHNLLQIAKTAPLVEIEVAIESALSKPK